MAHVLHTKQPHKTGPQFVLIPAFVSNFILVILDVMVLFCVVFHYIISKLCILREKLNCCIKQNKILPNLCQ